MVLPAQVVGDVGEGGAGCLGHAVVDDDDVVFALGQRRGRRIPFPQTVLCVSLLDLSHLVSGDGSFCRDDRKLDTGVSSTLTLQNKRSEQKSPSAS